MRQVAIVGFASESIQQDWPEDVEIWTLNNAWRYGFTRISRLFELHKVEQLTSLLGRESVWENQHWEWLRQSHDFPIYMIETDERIPTSRAYPLEEICADVFQKLKREDAQVLYMTSSASYMMAMAIHERVERIYLAGVEMASGTEFAYQRDGITYMIGLANGRGIEVVLSNKSGLMRARLYSYEGGQTVSIQVIQEHLRAYREQMVQAAATRQAALQSGDQNAADAAVRILQRGEGALGATEGIVQGTDASFVGRQVIELNLNGVEQKLFATLTEFNKLSGQHEQAAQVFKRMPSKNARQKLEELARLRETSLHALLQFDGAAQAFRHLLLVIDLHTPDLTIREI